MIREDVRRSLSGLVSRHSALLDKVSTELKGLELEDKIGSYKANLKTENTWADVGEVADKEKALSGLSLSAREEKLENIKSNLVQLEANLKRIRKIYTIYLEVDRDTT